MPAADAFVGPGVTSAALHETHVSIVFLVGDRAYKLKKPACYPFLDQSTPALREQACHREVELNRRLAPDVYLGVADIKDSDGAVCDHLVVMRRMREAQRLSTLARDGAVGDDDVMRLAHTVATFHAGATRSTAISAAGERDAIQSRWETGFTEIEPFVGTMLDVEVEREIQGLVRRYLSGRDHLFHDRIVAGRIVDGHGDLLADDVFLTADGPRVLDCLEFDDELRFGDVLADVAFLAMDLERLGTPTLAHRFLDCYRELSGETHPPSLEHHYVALRAHIRAKVACLRGDQSSIKEAASLHRIALVHLRKASVAIVVVGGAPGTGKTTLAEGIAARTCWAVLRSDEVRKDLAGMGHLDRSATGEVGTGIYEEFATHATYAGLLARARVLVERGQSVVLDATWGDARHRSAAAALATETSSDLVELCCDAPPDACAARIEHRAAHGRDASDATAEVAQTLALAADPWPDADVIDTSTVLGETGWADVMACVGQDRGAAPGRP